MMSPSKQALAEAVDAGETPQPEDRQAFPRSSVWISGSLSAGERSMPCDVLNVSAGGVRVRCAHACGTDAPVMLEIDGHAGIAVTEAWRKDDLSGLSFDAPADRVARFLGFLESARPSILEQRRFRRCSVMWSACVFSGGRTLDAMVLNLSAGGARIRLPDAPVMDDRATVSIGRFGDFPGRLAWRAGNEFGLEFLDPPERVAARVGAVLPRIREDLDRLSDRPG